MVESAGVGDGAAAAGTASEAEAPVGPSSEEEAAFLAQERENGVVVAAAAPMAVEEPQGDLPAMDDLVKRIPMPARDLLEELFRARFVTVRRMPRAALK